MNASPDTASLPPRAARPDHARLRRSLLAWYDRHKRDLPWRRRRKEAYAQLLAEFMLQQTQVATVIPYFERFIERFPTVSALAAAPRDDVLALWSGLGYYSRARNLHETARQIVERFHARVPDTVDELMSLPGIGRYTAGAIASVAYGRRAPILDGNVARVLSRLFALGYDGVRPTGSGHRADAPPVSRNPECGTGVSPAFAKKRCGTGVSPVHGRGRRAEESDRRSDQQMRANLWELAEAILPQKRCGDFNQALMELGATICSPAAPQCLLCPLRSLCRARALGLTDRIPPPRQRARVKALEVVVAAVAQNGMMLFTQRPQGGLWGGLWELPGEPLTAKEDRLAALDRLVDRLPVTCRVEPQPLPPVTRTLTHRRITFHIYRAVAASVPDGRAPVAASVPGGRAPVAAAPRGGRTVPAPVADPAYRWLAPHDLPSIGLSRACQAILEQLQFLPHS